MRLPEMPEMPEKASTRSAILTFVGAAAGLGCLMNVGRPVLGLPLGVASIGCLCWAEPFARKAEREAEFERARQVAEDRKQLAQYELLQPSLASTAAPSEELELANLQDKLNEEVSFFVFGESGSGKSSVGLYLLGELTEQKRCQVLVLDPHFNDWGDLPIVGNREEVFKSLHLIFIELQYRKADWALQVTTEPDPQKRRKDWTPFILLWDEVAAAISYAKSQAGKAWLKSASLDVDLSQYYPEWFLQDLKKAGHLDSLVSPSEALMVLASELRKFNGIMICLSQSGNCKALGIDEGFRSNYIQIHLGKKALQVAARTWRRNTPERNFIKGYTKGYPCMINEELGVHPTHGGYKVRAGKRKPQNIKPANMATEFTLKTSVPPAAYSGKRITFSGRATVPGIVPGIVPEGFPGNDGNDGNDERERWSQTPKRLSSGGYSDLLNPSFPSFPVEKTAVSPQGDRRIFLALKQRREAGVSKGDAAVEVIGGRRENAIKEYNRITCLFTDNWISDLIQQGMSDEDIIDLIWVRKTRHRTFKRENPTQWQAYLNRIQEHRQ